jgi:hypothetical protein
MAVKEEKKAAQKGVVICIPSIGGRAKPGRKKALRGEYPERRGAAGRTEQTLGKRHRDS